LSSPNLYGANAPGSAHWKILVSLACEELDTIPQNTYIFEASCFMIGSSSSRDNCSENDKTKKDNDLDATEPEFEFPEEANAEVIDKNDGYEEKGNIDRWIGSWTIVPVLVEPVFDDNSCSYQIVWSCDDIFQPVIPTCKL
jgi:hypothetical protein